MGRYGFAALYLAGAVFNLTYGRSHPAEFFGSFEASTWFGPYRWMIREVIVPNGAVFAVLIAGFQLAVAGLLLAGGTAMVVGLAAGLTFSLLIVPASNPVGGLANLALALAQGALLWNQVHG
ncbi:MAG: hypothetical protein OER93_06555 [Thermoleophilia bacterium]|nr:hypothetical protein [Thermoleophilia bacterium]